MDGTAILIPTMLLACYMHAVGPALAARWRRQRAHYRA